MNYNQLYIGIDREVRKNKDDIELSSADVTYWLNKALIEFVDSKYKELETEEKIRKELWYLYDEDSVSADPGTTTIATDAVGYDFDLSSTDIRYITSERATISYNSASKDVAVKVTTLDKLNEKIEDPFSEHKVHLSRMKPLKIDKANSVMLISDGNYSITTYKVRFVKNPDPFVILDAENTSAFTVLPEKTHNELITIAVRMILENETNPRYQSILNEENKLN